MNHSGPVQHGGTRSEPAQRADARPGPARGGISRSGLAQTLLLAALTVAAGCGFSGDACQTYYRQYAETLEEEGLLTGTVPTEAPYPMALVLSQDSINRLFAALSEGDLPALTWTYELYGIPFELTLDPELPLVQVGGARGCGDCLLLDMAFAASVNLFGIEYGGAGGSRFQFPLAMQDQGLEATEVLARLGEAEVLTLDVSLPGIPDSYLDAIEPFIAEAATIIVQEYYGDTELFTLEPWKFGQGDVRLQARGPIISPESGTVILGIHTNLFRPLEGAIEPDPRLPEGVDLALQIHPELVGQMIERMLHEGALDRHYTTSGDPSAAGSVALTFNGMSASENGLLEASFRLWQTESTTCGYVDLEAAFGLTITDEGIRLQAERVDITDAAGIGQVVSASEWLLSPFLDNMAAFSELTLNYRELDLPDDQALDLSAESFRIALDGNGLNIYLDIEAIVGSEER